MPSDDLGKKYMFWTLNDAGPRSNKQAQIWSSHLRGET